MFLLIHLSEFNTSHSFSNFLKATPFSLLIGTFSGLLYGTSNYYFNHRIYNRRPLGAATLIGTLSLGLISITSSSAGIKLYMYMEGLTVNYETVMPMLFSTGSITFIGYSFLMAFFASFLDQIDYRFGPGNLKKLMIGTYYNPKQEERIFMFLDLRSSTTHAEKLGHKKYSKLIQDCFELLSVVTKHKAEIYQYVGDEVVLTWTTKDGLKNANCIRAFQAFRENLLRYESHFQKNYGVFPEFKAGLNIGMVTAAEIGQVKRDIQYFGDAINVAARIQDFCNHLGHDLLFSDTLADRLPKNSPYQLISLGSVELKGLSGKTNLHSIEDFAQNETVN